MLETFNSNDNMTGKILEYIPMLVYMKDDKRNFLLGSKYSKDFVFKGYDKHSGDLRIDMVDCDKLTTEEDEYVLKNKELLIKEKPAKDFNGDTHWYRIIKAPIIENNKLDGLVTIARNIDAEKALESQKDLFIATLVHDLKNPLNAQQSCLNLLNSGAFGELNDSQKEILSVLLESVNSTKEMIYSLLQTYKYDGGVVTLDKKPCDVDKLLQTCIKEETALASERNVTLNYECKLKDKDKLLNIDEKQIRRVITNLLNNGICYAYTDSKYDICIRKKRNKIVFEFENFGPAISDDIKENIFEKYVTGASKFKTVGFGLGMYLSKKIIDAHEGKIYLVDNNEYNKFVFELPINNSNKDSKIVWE